MLKILLVVGGVWISFAFLFVIALAAAGAKSIPPETVEVAQTSASPEPRVVESPSTSQPTRRKTWWRIPRPVGALSSARPRALTG